MHRKKDQMFVTYISIVKRLTDPFGWVRRWHHWNHLGPRQNATVGKAEMPWIHCREEVSYERSVWEYLYAHVNESLPWGSLNHVVLDRTWERHWAIVSCDQFFFEIDLEMRLCMTWGWEKCWINGTMSKSSLFRRVLVVSCMSREQTGGNVMRCGARCKFRLRRFWPITTVNSYSEAASKLTTSWPLLLWNLWR